ncbi:hypothetical protein [Marinobacter segnicrescens]|uniref:hypothetical protein n=1 Tax=Marinobacter segnicrescens TaxID=430453 RepID=UPI003A94C6F0
MAARPDTYTLKVTVARLLELSYARNEGLTTRILREVGPASVSVASDGTATLSGKAGNVTFSASEVVQSIGLQIRRVGVNMEVTEDGELEYTARFLFAGAFALSARGTIDVEELILSCSGLLCRAARALKSRTASTDREIERALK